MKKVLSLLAVAIIGGFISLGSYKLFFDKNENIYKNEIEAAPIVRTNYSAIPAEQTDFTTAAQETVNSVVHVKNTSVQTVRDPFAEYFYGRGQGSKQFEQVGTGSGVIISADGYIVTNNHVVAKASEIEITLNDKKQYKAKFIGADPQNDIALLKIDAKDLPYITFGDSDAVKVGEWVLAVGNPYNLTSTVTAGIVSAKARDLHGNNSTESFIQTDAAVNPGNSGGALVNTSGQLVGINTAITSKTGSFVGYSFAVPSNIAKKIIEDIMEYGDVQRAYLGIYFEDLDAEKAKEYDLPTAQGILVREVIDKGAAQEAGIEDDDIIVKLNNVKITKFADFSGQLNAKRPGDVIQVTVIRDGKEMTIPVKLKNKFGKEGKGTDDYLGFYIGKLDELSKKEQMRYRINYGLKFNEVTNQNLSKRFGVEEGDILLSINGEKIKSVGQVENILENSQNKDYVVLEILTKQGKIEYVPLTMR
ncbi:Do family serine endopeptidase [Aureivirga sp. CE67]|uniref:Do family serine endopeptidase n=1 Tax=Aureivirga sp. CE67 TaxID=1788983 RepID=UPI0018CA2083|nr:Do family serine endopeptidase [Aureivirga sp. CE67]